MRSTMPGRPRCPRRLPGGSRMSSSIRGRSRWWSFARPERWTLPARIIDGTAIGKTLRAELAPDLAELKKKGVTPGLAVILVGEDPARQVYVRMKGKACEEAGIYSQTVKLAADTPENTLIAQI